MERINQYELLEKIGRGSFGEVFKGFAKETGQIVAIKVVDLTVRNRQDSTDLLDELHQEITVLRECHNPRITNFYESFVHENQLYLVMEYVAGGSLKDILRVRGSFQELYIAIILRELLLAVQFLHSQGKLHRDIKAANVLLSLEGEVKLADFGVSAQITQSVTKRHSFVGTPYWMAPEVITQSEYDQKADIWSVGITAMELAKGEPPLAHLTPMKVLFQIQSSPPPQLESSFSLAFQDFVRLCLQKDPSLRPDADSLLRHKFITSAKKKSFLTDLLDAATSLGHYRSSSTMLPMNTVLKVEPDTSHRHSRSSEEANKYKSSRTLRAAALHRKISSMVVSSRSGSSSSSRSNSTSKSVKAISDDHVALQELEDQYKTSLKDSFLGCKLHPGLEMAVTSVETEKEMEPALEALVVAVAKMEVKSRGLAQRIFTETTKLLPQK